ncbi:hypothetical protein ACF0H5_007338 [Mactra antiquata]
MRNRLLYRRSVKCYCLYKIFINMDKSDTNSADDKNGVRGNVKVKSEPEAVDTIKDYAENTMNELLGLFGYDDKVNSTDTENLNLDNYSENKTDEKACRTKVNERKTAAVDTHIDDSTADGLRIRLKQKIQTTVDEDGLALQHMNLVTALKRREQEDKETDPDTDSESLNDTNSTQQCAWCRKTGNKQVTLDTPTGTKVFCDEICFTQCRRASFKKSKTCDWCKHVRHTVSYVEFKDGETQLQFCSEKCLNQYKMSIFCKETQEHLKNVDKKADTPADSKDDEREILITPELWMRGEHARRAAEARESARERERQERHFKERDHRSVSSDKSPQKVGSKQEVVEKSRSASINHVKHEANVRHRRSLITERETDRSSPARSDRQNPSGQNETSYPAHVMSVPPWLYQAQLMGALVPGMIPYGHLSQMLLPGLVQQPPPPLLLQESTDRERQDESKKDSRKYPVHRQTTQSLQSPLSDGSVRSTPSGQDTQSRMSPNIAERRTSSLFPVDFPQCFAGQNYPPGMPNNAAHLSGIPGIPPVTMMVPFPVPLPLPVPVPIPIPLTVQQLKDLFGDKGETSSKNTSTLQVNTERVKDSRSPVHSYVHSPQSVISSSSDLNSFDKHTPRSGSRNSCPDLSMFVGINDLRTKRTNGQPIKRSRTPETMKSLDLSRRSKIPKYDYNISCSDSNDGVIDLSASRMKTPKLEDTESDNDGNMLNAGSDTTLIHDDNDSGLDEVSTVPKIHIITHSDTTPLNQPLPLPPTDNSYSSRRGLILDAPTVQKKSRSPSPDRRVYVRNVPRDIIEAARRRCMRARIRTK